MISEELREKMEAEKDLDHGPFEWCRKTCDYTQEFDVLVFPAKSAEQKDFIAPVVFTIAIKPEFPNASIESFNGELRILPTETAQVAAAFDDLSGRRESFGKWVKFFANYGQIRIFDHALKEKTEND